MTGPEQDVPLPTIEEQISGLRDAAVREVQMAHHEEKKAEETWLRAKKNLKTSVQTALKVGLAPKELENASGRSARSISLLVGGERKKKTTATKEVKQDG